MGELVRTNLFSGIVNDAVEFRQPVGIAVRGVVAEQIHVVVLDLDITSWLEASVHGILAAIVRLGMYVGLLEGLFQ